MAYNPKIHHRRSIRLQGYDYSQNGLYFVTICTHDRLPIFGTISNGEMTLSSIGQIAYTEWFNTAQIRPEIQLHEFIVMPNHIHGIIEITSMETHSPDRLDAGNNPIESNHQISIAVKSRLGNVVKGYKSAATKQINRLPEYQGAAVWQRNYYEHIIRHQGAYQNITAYIQSNPQRWLEDIHHR